MEVATPHKLPSLLLHTIHCICFTLLKLPILLKLLLLHTLLALLMMVTLLSLLKHCIHRGICVYVYCYMFRALR